MLIGMIYLHNYRVQSLLSNEISGVSKPRGVLASFMLVQPFLVNFEMPVVLTSSTVLEHITHFAILLINSDYQQYIVYTLLFSKVYLMLL